MLDITDECPETTDPGIQKKNIYTGVCKKKKDIPHLFTSKMDLQLTRWAFNRGII